MATNYARASYTEVVDLQTTNGKTSIIGIHTPVGFGPYSRLRGFFNQFRKYRYKGISSLKMVPAANLPVDPLGLTGVIGTTDLMDPRDALNPILFHGCHGEHLGMILDTIYSNDEYTYQGANYDADKNVSDSLNENLVSNNTSDLIGAYYRCLTDTTWRKFGIQSGVSLRGLHPLVWKLARNTPLLPRGNNTGTSDTQTSSQNGGLLTPVRSEEGILGLDRPQDATYYTPGGPQSVYGALAEVDNVDVFGKSGRDFNPMYVQEMTTGVTGLGWLPTASLVSVSNAIAPAVTMLPKIFMGVLVLPPSYNVEQYFRMVIRHEFEFKDFTTSLGLMDMPPNSTPNVLTTNYFNWIDYDDSGKYSDLIKDTNVGDTLDVVGGSSEIISDGVA